jgi:hypothetical protein
MPMKRRKLHRRYGHAGKSPRVVSRGPTGAVMWDGSSKLRGHRLFWNGSGSNIKWVASDGFIPRSPAIDDSFNSLKEATAAVKRFLNTDADGEAEVCARCGKGAAGCKCVGAGGTSGPFHSRSH